MPFVLGSKPLPYPPRTKPHEVLWAHDLSIRGKRFVQLSDAGSPPRRAAAPHGPQFRLPVLKEDEDKSYALYTNQASNKSIEERSARSLPISDQQICSLQRCPDPCESEHLNTPFPSVKPMDATEGSSPPQAPPTPPAPTQKASPPAEKHSSNSNSN